MLRFKLDRSEGDSLSLCYANGDDELAWHLRLLQKESTAEACRDRRIALRGMLRFKEACKEHRRWRLAAGRRLDDAAQSCLFSWRVVAGSGKVLASKKAQADGHKGRWRLRQSFAGLTAHAAGSRLDPSQESELVREAERHAEGKLIEKAFGAWTGFLQQAYVHI